MSLQTTVAIRQENSRVIKCAIKSLGVATKKEVALATGLSFSTCNNLINDMVETNEILTLQEMRPNDMGRPSLAYQLNALHSLILCVVMEKQLLQSFLHLTTLDLYGRIVCTASFEHVELTEKEIHAAIGFALHAHKNIAVIGISVPGILNADGTILACDCDGINGVSLAETLSNTFGIPVLCENDMNLLAYGLDTGDDCAEMGSVAVIADYKNIVQGAGLVVEGNILKGNTNFAGEISYLPALNLPPLERIVFQIVCLTAILNPALVAIVSDQWAKEDVPHMQERLYKALPAQHCPALRILPDSSGISKGLARLCLQFLEKPSA